LRILKLIKLLTKKLNHKTHPNKMRSRKFKPLKKLQRSRFYVLKPAQAFARFFQRANEIFQPPKALKASERCDLKSNSLIKDRNKLALTTVQKQAKTYQKTTSNSGTKT
jgi:hypothetical protein